MRTEPTNSTPREDWRAFVDAARSITKRDVATWAVAWPFGLLTLANIVLYLTPLSVAKDEVRSDTEYFLAAAGLTIWFFLAWLVVFAI